MIKLFSFGPSSASYRVRICLKLKNIDYEIISTSLSDGAHLTSQYSIINPQNRVPFLIDGDFQIGQSLAIIDYLNEKYLTPEIYPQDIFNRARARAFAHHIVSDIFPLQNLGLRKKLGKDFGYSEEDQAKWSAHWIEKGFVALENEIVKENKNPEAGYLFAPYPTIAEICLIPQMRNAFRYKADTNKFPTLLKFYEKAMQFDAFKLTANHD